MRRPVQFCLPLAALACCALAYPPAAAATTERLEEIVVTGSLRALRDVDTAGSVSVLSAAALRARAARHFEEVVEAVPNLNFAGGTGRARFFQIRGIGERSQFTQPLNPSVGVLLDDVDFSGAGSALTLFDVEQVEVLRGPQGTRYGANALAGLVNVVTRDPQPTFGATVRAGAASYGTRTLGAVLNAPLSSSLAARLAVEGHRGDGFYSNGFLGRDDNNARDELTLRTKLLWQPADRFEARLTYSHIDVDNGYDAFTLDNSRTTLSDEPGRDAQRSDAIALDARWSLERVDLQFVGHAARSDLLYSFDEDWTFAGFHPDGYVSVDSYARDRDTASAEIRVKSRPASRLAGGDWVLGLYVLDSAVDLRRDYSFLPGPFDSAYDFTTTAAFGELVLPLADAWRLTGGGRIERRESRYADSDALRFEPVDRLWGGRLAVEFDASDDLLLYLSLARGYKAGGFNVDGSLDADLREFAPEYLWEVEIGAKAELLDGRLRLQGTAFYDRRRDQQVKSSLVRPRPDGSTEFIDFIGNAAEGTNQGLEFEGLWIAAPGVQLSANLGLLDARFDRFINEFGEDLAGRQQAQAPDFGYSIALDAQRGPWFGRIGVDGQDAFYFSDRHGLRAQPRALLGARVGFRSRRVEVSLFGRNLTDRDYDIRGFGSFGNDPRKGYVVEPYVQYGEPRVVGLTLEIHTEPSP